MQYWAKNTYSRYRAIFLLAIVTIVIAVLFSQAPISLHAEYHHFANQHTWMGLPHAENVLSNLPFLFIGMWGLLRLSRYVVASDIERFCWIGFFSGVTLTAVGSAYYHLEPNHWRLIWDRIPIAFSFIFLFTAVISERVSLRLATMSLLPLLIYSLVSIFYWYFTEIAGYGDMRAYILVQLLPMILIPLLIKWFTPRYTHGWMLILVAGWYALAKVFECLDGIVYMLNGHLSGHGIKHLLAAMACAQVVWMLEKRKAIK